MNAKTIMIGIVILLLATTAVGLVLMWLGATTRQHRLGVEMKYGVPELIDIVNGQKDYYFETGSWPEPPNADSDTLFRFVSTRTDDETRIDTYDTLMLDRWIELLLSADGAITMQLVVTAEK